MPTTTEARERVCCDNLWAKANLCFCPKLKNLCPLSFSGQHWGSFGNPTRRMVMHCRGTLYQVGLCGCNLSRQGKTCLIVMKGLSNFCALLLCCCYSLIPLVFGPSMGHQEMMGWKQAQNHATMTWTRHFNPQNIVDSPHMTTGASASSAIHQYHLDECQMWRLALGG